LSLRTFSNLKSFLNEKNQVKDERAKLISNGLIDMGNYTFLILVIGQFIPEKNFAVVELASGVALTAVCYLIGLFLIKSRNNGEKDE
jgi:hypothetical protein